MIGLGCGARSYTRALHYSSEYAVGSMGVREIIGAYIDHSDESFACVDYGCEVGVDEQRRRWLIKSLFHLSGLDVSRYIDLFGAHPADEFVAVRQMIDDAYLVERDGLIVPTAAGFEWSDALAPMLFSDAVQGRSREYQFH
jgi:oxygen-independent coproporphyrinogen-3 oxidase